MQERLDPATIHATSAARGDIAALLQSQRAHLEGFLRSQRQRLAALRESLSQHAGHVAGLEGDDTSAQLQHTLDKTQSQRDKLAEDLRDRDEQLQRQRQEIETTQQQLWTLSQRDEQRQKELSQAMGDPAEEGLRQELEDLRRRYELAMDDVKAERARCAELEGRLAQGPAAALGAAPAGGLDWEAQKRQLLASLESDFDEDDEADRRERLGMQEVIRKTESAIAGKEREIADLQRLLEEQSANFGSMAVGAAAVAEVLDKDEIIQQERKNLELLQDEWKDKLRQAEVEISVQRAKLARSQMELEEKSRQLEQQLTKRAPDDDAAKEDASRTGRWLRRLGLKGGDEE